MGGRFGKYGDLKRKQGLRDSIREKGRLEKNSVPRGGKKRKNEKQAPQK